MCQLQVLLLFYKREVYTHECSECCNPKAQTTALWMRCIVAVKLNYVLQKTNKTSQL
jgi:hypothetical protein